MSDQIKEESKKASGGRQSKSVVVPDEIALNAARNIRAQLAESVKRDIRILKDFGLIEKN